MMARKNALLQTLQAGFFVYACSNRQVHRLVMYVFFCVHVTGSSSTKQKKGERAMGEDEENTAEPEVDEKEQEVVPPEPEAKKKHTKPQKVLPPPKPTPEGKAKAAGKAKGKAKAKSAAQKDVDKENTYVNPAWHKGAHAWIIKKKTGKQALQATRRRLLFVLLFSE